MFEGTCLVIKGAKRSETEEGQEMTRNRGREGNEMDTTGLLTIITQSRPL